MRGFIEPRQGYVFKTQVDREPTEIKVNMLQFFGGYWEECLNLLIQRCFGFILTGNIESGEFIAGAILPPLMRANAETKMCPLNQGIGCQQFDL